MELNREQAIDILERFDSSQGQRAGRELWNVKPLDVQEQDIAIFSRDVALLKDYIKELTEKNKKLSAQNYMLCPDGTIAMIPTVKSVITDTVQEVIASIDEMFRRQRYESMWIGKNGAVLGRVDIGDAQECWDGYIKPEIERMLEEGK